MINIYLNEAKKNLVPGISEVLNKLNLQILWGLRQALSSASERVESRDRGWFLRVLEEILT